MCSFPALLSLCEYQSSRKSLSWKLRALSSIVAWLKSILWKNWFACCAILELLSPTRTTLLCSFNLVSKAKRLKEHKRAVRVPVWIFGSSTGAGNDIFGNVWKRIEDNLARYAKIFENTLPQISARSIFLSGVSLHPIFFSRFLSLSVERFTFRKSNHFRVFQKLLQEISVSFALFRKSGISLSALWQAPCIWWSIASSEKVFPMPQFLWEMIVSIRNFPFLPSENGWRRDLIMVIELSGVQFGLKSYVWFFEITSMISEQNCTSLSSVTTLLNPFWNRTILWP